MTAVNRPHTPGFFEPNRQLHSMRPDLIRKIKVLRQRLAALEALLASSTGPETPVVRTFTHDAVTPQATGAGAGAGETLAAGDAASRRMRGNGSGAARMRQP